MTARRLTQAQRAHAEEARAALRKLGSEVAEALPTSLEGQAKGFYRMLSAPRPVRAMPDSYGNFYTLERARTLDLIGQAANEGGLS